MTRSTSGRPTSVARAPRTRSAVTNGKRLHVVKAGDTAWARRFRDILAEIVDDLGGFDGLSEGQRQLARRCATLAISCEQMEGELVAGRPIDLDFYGKMTDRMGRAFRRLGLSRKKRKEEPTSLRTYLSQRDQKDKDPREKEVMA